MSEHGTPEQALRLLLEMLGESKRAPRVDRLYAHPDDIPEVFMQLGVAFGVTVIEDKYVKKGEVLAIYTNGNLKVYKLQTANNVARFPS